MTRALLPAVALIFAVGCNATVNGTLVDGLTGQPVAGKAADAGEDVEPLRVVAKSVTVKEDGTFEDNPGAGMTCMSFVGDVGPDGNFALSGLCLSQTAYKLELSDKNWFLADMNHFPQGMDATSPISLKAWRAPMGTAVNILSSGNNLEPVRSRQKIKSEVIKGTESDKVYYPEGLPKQTPLIGEGQYLVLSGTNADLTLAPLINSGPREFKIEEGMESGPTMQDWTYIGTTFTDDETFERVSANVDASKVVTVEKAGHKATFIPAGAVSPPGRYALWQEGKDSAFIVDFGTAGSAPGTGGGEGENAGGEGGEGGE